MKTKEEELMQQGIGEAAYHEPQNGIGTAAYHEPTTATTQPANTQQKTTQAQTQQPQTQAQTQQPIKVMEGVTQGTQQKLNSLQTGYQPGSAAQNVQNQLQALQTSKPGGYTSQYDQQLNDILQQIQGQKPFSYSFNQDALFNSLSDLYTQQAKQAAANAQGMAAGLTGGYGNSAAQAAGSQAFQQAILPLYDKATELARFAYDVHQGEQANQYNQLNALMNMDENAYNRYRDTVGDWEREREYLTGRYDTEEDRGYNRYLNDLDYYTKLAQIENADYRSEQERQEAIRQFNEQFNWQKETNQRDYDRSVLESDRNFDLQQQQFNETIRQFNESLDWDKMSSQQKYAADYVLAILQNGQMPSEELLELAGLSAEDAAKMMAKITSGGTGTPKKTTTSKDWTLPTAGWEVWKSDPANKETIQRYKQQEAAKDVNRQLRNGQLPSAAEVAAAGMNQTDVMKQYMQNTTPANPTAEELMRIRLLKGG